MNRTQQWRLERLNMLREKAETFSKAYPMGRVLIKSIDLCSLVARHGLGKELESATALIQNEMQRQIRADKDRSLPVREMFFALCECLNLMVESLIVENEGQEEAVDGKRAEIINEPLPRHPSTSDNGIFENEIKDEPMDFNLFEATNSQPPTSVSTMRTAKEEGSTMTIAKEEEEPADFDFSKMRPEDLMPVKDEDEEGDVEDEEWLPEDDEDSQPSSSASGNAAQRVAATASLTKTGVTCNVCGLRCPDSESFIRHFNHAHRTPKEVLERFRCSVCLKIKKNATELKKHMEAHSVTKRQPQQCKYCSKTVRTASELAIHMRTHTGEKPFSCELCDKKFASASEVKKHVRAGHKIPPHECQTCGERFRVIGLLRQHQKEECFIEE